MKALALASAIAMTCALAAPSPAAAQVQAGRTGSSALSIPVTGTSSGGTFSGIFKLEKFAAQQGVVYATGLLTGTVTTTAGAATSIVRTVSMPVNIGQSAAGAAGTTQAAAAPTAITQASCDILHLDLGPLSLDLLGLNVDLSRVILDITAEPGAGNLLGNLLCAVTGLLDNPTGLANVLNQILAAL